MSLNIPKIYSDPIISRKRLGTAIQPFKHIKESITVEKCRVLLTEIPNDFEKVKVIGLGRQFYESEQQDRELSENIYWVDYINGVVYFHESLEGRTLTFEYLGEGVWLYPDSRVYLTGDKNFITVRDKFVDVDRAILVERHRIDEQIISHPQPSEVVDMRIDYNGNIFRVAKDRIDAEQRKIEEAYVDAKGKRFNSLKLRIDSLQLATEDSFDEQEKTNRNIWATIDLIPGQIQLETGKIEKKLDGEISLLKSQIELVPEQISLKVEELREYVNGELNSSYSLINMLSDEIELKVDVNGVVSAINLNKDGVRINGEKIWLNGQTKIDNAVIKSAHIDNISADKITAGTLDAGKITIRGGSATNYTTIKNDFFESRGRHEREWRGEVTVHDVKIRMENGRIRARNDNLERSIYFSDNGISTFADGSGQYIYDIEKTSGTIEFFSYEYGTPRGITVYSTGTFAASTRNVVLDAKKDIEFKAAGLINFMGQNVRGTGIGVREPHTNFYIGTSGTRDGELRVTDKRFYNDGNPRYMDIRASYLKGIGISHRNPNSYVYLGSDLGVRVTSRGTNKNDPIIYRPIQASAFQVRSSEKAKENINPANTKISGLKAINELKVVNFNYIGDKIKRLGFIAENSPTISKDGEFVELTELMSHLVLAMQELSKKIDAQEV